MSDFERNVDEHTAKATELVAKVFTPIGAIAKMTLGPLWGVWKGLYKGWKGDDKNKDKKNKNNEEAGNDNMPKQNAEGVNNNSQNGQNYNPSQNGQSMQPGLNQGMPMRGYGQTVPSMGPYPTNGLTVVPQTSCLQGTTGPVYYSSPIYYNPVQDPYRRTFINPSNIQTGQPVYTFNVRPNTRPH